MLTAREDWKKVQHMNHLKFDEWVAEFGANNYYDGVHDCIVALAMCLHDDHKFGTKRLAKLVAHIYDVVDSMNKKDLVTPTEVIEGLKKEGVDITEQDALIRVNGKEVKGVFLK